MLGPAAAATTVRVRGGELLVSDGPFAETKEVIVGFDILECADLDEAIEVARAHPMAWTGRLELRPFVDLEATTRRWPSPEAGRERGRRRSYARIVATLIRVTGDWTLAEDCAQEALAAALERWPRDGVPAIRAAGC